MYDWFMSKKQNESVAVTLVENSSVLVKSRGGRGHKSENKYERLTVTMPPDLLARLDEFALARDLSRSEALTQLAGTGLKFTRTRKKKES